MGFRERIRNLIPAAPPEALSRETIARHVLRGEGIEIGALHDPLKVPPTIRVHYVDRMAEPELRRQYPELATFQIAPVEIIDDGERLEKITDASQDFVIANHFLEHCQDPLGAVANFLRVLRPGGAAYLAVPRHGNTFDRDRPVTPLEHLLRDWREGTAWSRRQHYEEWVRVAHKIEDEGWAANRIEHFMAIDYSIHFHVWDAAALLKMWVALREEFGFPLEVELFVKLPEEYVTVLRKM